MTVFLRPLFLRLLLLCVMLNLGDAPYVDELMAEVGQEQAIAGPAKASAEQAGLHKHSVYEELIALVAMPMPPAPAPSFDEPGQRLPATVRWLPLSARASPIERPPRFVAAA